jgi:hypothetical protein
MLGRVPLDLGPRNSRNRCSKHISVQLQNLFEGNRSSFGEITGMVSENSTDGVRDISMDHDL